MTTTEEHTITHEFELHGTDSIPEVSACWWRAGFSFDVTITKVYVKGRGKNAQFVPDWTATEIDSTGEFIVHLKLWDFDIPAPIGIKSHYTMPYSEDTYIITQYPSPDS